MRLRNKNPEDCFGELTKYLTERELARRWRHSQRTLQRWRAEGKGVTSLRIGRRIVYRLEDVLRFEAACETGEIGS